MQGAITVRQLNMYVKSLLEGDARLADIAVTGEISNFKNHYSSGHLYFTLKDSEASIRCVMFRSYASRIKFEVEDGMQVVLRGRASVYEKDGQYQFYAEEMTAYGAGDIALKFEQIKKRLSDEGLFDPQSKRPLPAFPKAIAVVTSDTGAAVRDIIGILSRRFPLCNVIMCPVSVQGALAVPEMVETLDRIYALGTADLIIIGRGGGSVEDLWAFNSEELARKLFESPVPVISAVGHETDFTICDFTADLRAPTPSAAAELAVPDKAELSAMLAKYNSSLKNSLSSSYNYGRARLERATASHYLKKPADAVISPRAEQADRLTDRLASSCTRFSDTADRKFSSLAARLDALSPLKTLSRGYAVAENEKGIIKSVRALSKGERISLRFSDGRAGCEIIEREE